MRNCTLLIAIAIVIGLSGCTNRSVINRQKSLHLVHDVYFSLNDNSEVAREKLVKNCYKYLSDHPGIVFFAAGEMVKSHKRDVNVRDWDVSLHIVFKSEDHHDQYQQAPDHHKFIEKNEDNWKSVRVFDSFTK